VCCRHRCKVDREDCENKDFESWRGHARRPQLASVLNIVNYVFASDCYKLLYGNDLIHFCREFMQLDFSVQNSGLPRYLRWHRS
jgi:hypothetical protein